MIEWFAIFAVWTFNRNERNIIYNFKHCPFFVILYMILLLPIRIIEKIAEFLFCIFCCSTLETKLLSKLIWELRLLFIAGKNVWIEKKMRGTDFRRNLFIYYFFNLLLFIIYRWRLEWSTPTAVTSLPFRLVWSTDLN